MKGRSAVYKRFITFEDDYGSVDRILYFHNGNAVHIRKSEEELVEDKLKSVGLLVKPSRRKREPSSEKASYKSVLPKLKIK